MATNQQSIMGTPKSECIVASTSFSKGSDPKSDSRIPVSFSRRLSSTPTTPASNNCSTSFKKRASLPTRRKTQIGDGKTKLQTSKPKMAVSYLYRAGAGDPEFVFTCAPETDSSDKKSSCLIMNACQQGTCRRKHAHDQQFFFGLFKTLFNLAKLLILVALLVALNYISYCMWSNYYGRNPVESVKLQLPDQKQVPDYQKGAHELNEPERMNVELVDLFANRNSFDLTETHRNWSMFDIIRKALGSLFSWMGSFLWLDGVED